MRRNPTQTRAQASAPPRNLDAASSRSALSEDGRGGFMTQHHHSQRAGWLTGAAFAATTLCAVPALADTPPSSDQAAQVGEIVVSAPHYVPVAGDTGTKTNTPIIQTPQS